MTTTEAKNPELAVAEGLDLVLLSEDEVLVQFGTRSHPSELLRDPELTGLLGTLVARLLHGPRRLEDLVDAVPEHHRAETRELLLDLLERGILTDLGRDPVEQYLRYAFDGAHDLDGRRLAVLGAGPLGARIASSLALHPLEHLVLLDDRADSADERLDLRLLERLRAAGHENVDRIGNRLDVEGIEAAVSSSDLTVLALDRQDPGLAHLVNRVCLRARSPWLLATIDGNRGLAGPLFVPGHTACYSDYRTLVESTTPSGAMIRRYERWAGADGRPRIFTGLPAYADIIAGFAALATVHFLARGACFATGRQLVVDFERMRIDVEDVLKLPRCPVCGAARNAYRPPFPSAIVDEPAPDGFAPAEPSR